MSSNLEKNRKKREQKKKRVLAAKAKRKELADESAEQRLTRLTEEINTTFNQALDDISETQPASPSDLEVDLCALYCNDKQKQPASPSDLEVDLCALYCSDKPKQPPVGTLLSHSSGTPRAKGTKNKVVLVPAKSLEERAQERLDKHYYQRESSEQESASQKNNLAAEDYYGDSWYDTWGNYYY